MQGEDGRKIVYVTDLVEDAQGRVLAQVSDVVELEQGEMLVPIEGGQNEGEVDVVERANFDRR